MALAVISYDIVDDKRRNKTAKVLLDYGQRVQYSVFELSTVEKIPEIKDRINRFIDRKEDNIRFYYLCQDCENKKKVIGREKALLDDTDYLII